MPPGATIAERPEHVVAAGRHAPTVDGRGRPPDPDLLSRLIAGGLSGPTASIAGDARAKLPAAFRSLDTHVRAAKPGSTGRSFAPLLGTIIS